MFMFQFLPREAMRKRGLCCGPVSVRPSVRLTACHVGGLYPESRRLKISSDFFLGPVAPSFCFFTPPRRRYPIPFSRGAKYRGLRFSTEIAVYLGNGTR